MPEKNGASSYRRFLQGDRMALEALVYEYSDALVRFAYCYVKDSAAAEDIMEDAFAALLGRRWVFAERNNVRAYLYKIVRNKSVDYLRKHKKQVPLADLENVLYSLDTSDKALERKERNQTLYRCMQALPTQYREVLYLAYFEGYETEVIAKITKRTKKQIYNLTARAKTSLKELLIKEGISYEDV